MIRRVLAIAMVVAVCGMIVQATSSSPLSRHLLQSRRSFVLPHFLENTLLGRPPPADEPLVALLWSSMEDLDGDGVEEEEVERWMGFIPPPEIQRNTGTPIDATENIPHKHIGNVKFEEITLRLGSNIDREFMDIELSSWSFGASQRKKPEGLDIMSFSWGVCNAGRVVEGPDGQGCTERWPPRKKGLSIVYLSSGSMQSGELSFPALHLENAVVTEVQYPTLDSSSRTNDDCYITVTFANGDSTPTPMQRRQYSPLTIRKRIEANKSLPVRKQKQWLCSNFRFSFDVSEDPLATSIYHPCLGCPPPFFPEFAARKGLNAVNVRQAFVEPPELRDDSPLSQSGSRLWQVVSDTLLVVPFTGVRSCDFFLKMEQCSARDGPKGEPNLLGEGNVLTCREAGTGLATGRRQYTPGTRDTREAGSGMATGKRQHGMVVIPSDDPDVSIYLHMELQLHSVSRPVTCDGRDQDCDDTSFALLIGSCSERNSDGKATFSIVGALASTQPPLIQPPNHNPVPDRAQIAP